MIGTRGISAACGHRGLVAGARGHGGRGHGAHTWGLLAATMLLGCGAAHLPPPTPVAPQQAPGTIAPDTEARAVDMSGSCAWARAPGDSARYRVAVRILGAPGDTVTVYADATFGAEHAGNSIGRVPAGVHALADGPLHDATTQQTGYALLVRGATGRVCRGYIDARYLVSTPTPPTPSPTADALVERRSTRPGLRSSTTARGRADVFVL